MNGPSRTVRRRRARFVARAGAIGSAIMLMVTAWSAMTPSGAATNAGNAEVVDPATGQPLASGGSATDFTLKLPADAACTGDSPNDGYRVQSFMVPSSVDPNTLQFGANGPNPPGTGASFRQPLFDTSSTPYANAQTAAAGGPGQPGPIVNIPAFDFAVFSPGQIPAGTYNLGIACTLGPADADQLDKYWTVQLTFATNPADRPAQVTWAAEAPLPPPSTTTTTPGATTTTAPGETTTTTAASGTTTTTTTAGTGTATTIALASDSTTTPPVVVAGTSTEGLPITGSGVLALAWWAGLLLIFGRMVVLLGRPITERHARGR